MTFATPIIAAIAAAIAIPALVILYFLKLRRRDMEVSSTLLWKKAIQDLQANAPFQKLRNNILLILQLLALIVALLAIAQPELRHRGVSTARRIIMIDRSASMNTLDGDAKPAEPATAAGGAGNAVGAGTDAAATVAPSDAPGRKPITRLDAAKKKALELVASLKEPSFLDDKAEEAMVIAFDTSATVVQTFTPNKAMLREAIERITPSDAPSGLERAYDLARAYTGTKKFEEQVKENKGFVATGPGAAIHIFSDGRLPDGEKIQTAPEDHVVYHAVGASDSPNIGITGLRAERSFDTPSRVNIFIGLQSTDTRPRTVDLELTIDGTPQAIKGIQLPAATQPVGSDSARSEAPPEDSNTGPTTAIEPSKPRLVPGINGAAFPIDRVEAGVATVRVLVDERDALPTDNVGYLTIPPAKRLSAVLVTNGNLFVKSALDGLNLSKFDVKSPSEFQEMLDKGQTVQYDVSIFDRVLPTVTLADKSKGPGLPPGRSLVLGAVPPPPLGLIDEGSGKGDLILAYERDHPALRLAALDKVVIAAFRKTRIAPDTPVKVLARGEQGPAIVEVTDTNLDAIVVPWDVGESNWPFDPGWVLFLAGSVLHLSETNAGALSEGVRAGDTLTTRLPPGSTEVRLVEPDGKSVRLEPGPDGSVSYGPILRDGMYAVTWEGQATPIDQSEGTRATRRIAANLLDPYESDVGATPRLAMAREEVKMQSERESDLTRKLWPYLLLGTLGVLMLEWFVYNRKVAI